MELFSNYPFWVFTIRHDTPTGIFLWHNSNSCTFRRCLIFFDVLKKKKTGFAKEGLWSCCRNKMYHLWCLLVFNNIALFFQNFSPQMSGGYDDKSPAMPVPGPMVRHFDTQTLFNSLFVIGDDTILISACLAGPNGISWSSRTSWF